VSPSPSSRFLGPLFSSLLALGCVPALVLGAAPLSAYARATAEQLAARQPYLQAVLPAGAAAVMRKVRP
jgi:hypothetical protein